MNAYIYNYFLIIVTGAIGRKNMTLDLITLFFSRSDFFSYISLGGREAEKCHLPFLKIAETPRMMLWLKLQE